MKFSFLQCRKKQEEKSNEIDCWYFHFWFVVLGRFFWEEGEDDKLEELQHVPELIHAYRQAWDCLAFPSVHQPMRPHLPCSSVHMNGIRSIWFFVSFAVVQILSRRWETIRFCTTELLFQPSYWMRNGQWSQKNTQYWLRWV